MSADPSPIRVLSVDDHPLLRQGIAGLVALQSDMTLVAEAANGREAIQQFRSHHPDVTLMDLQMPEMNGLDAILAIRSEFPDVRIVALTTYIEDGQALRALNAGARAFVPKSSLHKELLETIRAVHAGKKSFPTDASCQIARHAAVGRIDQCGEAKERHDSLIQPQAPLLTRQETLVLRLIGSGLSNKQIARDLQIAPETVKSHAKHIFSKLATRTRAESITRALKLRLL